VCGICGVIQLGGDPRLPVSEAALEAMTDAMRHRGPDDAGLVIVPGAAIGARRLSIIDVEGGHQPFANEDDTVWGAQNGEIYNHAELHARLRSSGHVLRSRCDTEVLPHLYEELGPAFCESLRGIFAIAIWDARRRRAVLARDHLGVKPLYYAARGDLLVFASELKCLLASGLVEPEIDYEAIDAYLTLGYVPTPRTPLAGVSKLMPGHRLVVEAGGWRIEEYWRYPAPVAQPRSTSLRDSADAVLAALDRSVEMQLVSDVPLGAMLSGGLDSSLIVALMARRMRDPVRTFSVGFREAGAASELPHARAVARALGADHHELELSFTDDTVSLEELVWHLDEPVADLSALGFLALSDLAARHVTVALSGQGADELFGGYGRYRSIALAGRLGPLRPVAAAIAARGTRRTRALAPVLAARDPAARFLASNGRVMDASLRARLVRGPLAALDGGSALAAVRERARGLDAAPLPSALFLDARLGLVDDMLHYFDRTSMARSLEVRVPFLDHELVELAARIPPSHKVRGATTKRVLKLAARGIVPDEIIDRPKVGFFSNTVDAWVEARLGDVMSDYLLDPGARSRSFLAPGAVEGLLVARAAGDRRGSRALLALLVLEAWLATAVPRALSGVAVVS
jgi:asparagine synthase (glutamine-hydrolysing)